MRVESLAKAIARVITKLDEGEDRHDGHYRVKSPNHEVHGYWTRNKKGSAIMRIDIERMIT